RKRSLSGRQDRCAAAWPARARGATTQRGIGYLTRRKTVTTTEEDRLGAVSGAAGSCGRETGSIKELSLLRAGLFESEVDEIIFGMRLPRKNGVRFQLRPSHAIPKKARNVLVALLPSPARARSRRPLCSPLPAGLLQ